MGGSITWDWVDQARMTPAMAADFRDMAAEFRRVWGVDLLATSGIRLDSEQEQIFRERYVPNSQVNGRRVYDRRWWNGVLWARISSAGTVAVPGSSNHQLGYGRKGAVDLRDGGSDPGVTRFGTARNLWLRANAWRWGFNPDEGIAVNEAWHYRYTRDPYRPAPTPAPIEDEDMIEDIYTAFAKTGGQPVKAGQRANLHINDARHVAVVRGPAKHVSGNLAVQIEGGVPYAGCVQVTPIVVTRKDGKAVRTDSLRAREIVFTGGETLGEVTVNCALAEGQRLSFVVGGSSHDIVVKSAVFRGAKFN